MSLLKIFLARRRHMVIAVANLEMIISIFNITRKDNEYKNVLLVFKVILLQLTEETT